MMVADYLTLTLTALALLVLVAGSVLVALALLGLVNGPNYYEDSFVVMQFTWPFTLIVASALGAIAIARVHGFSAGLTLFVSGTIGSYVFVLATLRLIYRITGRDLQDTRTAALFVPVVFLLVNSMAWYIAWSRILHPD
jgi:hypothetical protein